MINNEIIKKPVQKRLVKRISGWNKVLTVLLLFFLTACSNSYEQQKRQFQMYLNDGKKDQAFEMIKQVPDHLKNKEQLFFEYQQIYLIDLDRMENLLVQLRNLPASSFELRQYIIGEGYLCKAQNNYACIQSKYEEYYNLNYQNQSVADLYSDFLVDSMQFDFNMSSEYLMKLRQANDQKYKFSDHDDTFTQRIKFNYFETLVFFLMNQEKFEESLPILDSLIRENPDDPELYMKYIECLYFSGEVEEAKNFANMYYDRFSFYARFMLVYDALIVPLNGNA